jgi:hypothetical protein
MVTSSSFLSAPRKNSLPIKKDESISQILEKAKTNKFPPGKPTRRNEIARMEEEKTLKLPLKKVTCEKCKEVISEPNLLGEVKSGHYYHKECEEKV